MTTTHDAPASTTTPSGYELREVDPASLVDNPNNARRAHRDREGLAASIGALGILHPPLVRQLADGRLELIAGERRKYSAIKAGSPSIPVFVRDDLSDLHQVAGMLVENHDRDGLTPTEEATAIQQLAGFDGVTQRDITAMTGIKAGDIRSALKVAGSQVATAVGERHDLSMEHLVALAEFDTDTEAVKRLVERAVKDPARFDHLVAELRRDHDDRVAFQRHCRPDHRGRCGPGRAGERLVASRGCGLALRPPGTRRGEVPHPGQAPELSRSRRSSQGGGRGLRTGLSSAWTRSAMVTLPSAKVAAGLPHRLPHRQHRGCPMSRRPSAAG